MGVLAHHVPSIEQLKPGLVEVIEESGNTKQFFRMFRLGRHNVQSGYLQALSQSLAVLPSSNPTRS